MPPFTASLRTKGADSVRLGSPDAKAITVRVEVPEVWDVVTVHAPAAESVLSVKLAALRSLYPDIDYPDNWVIKLGGFEVLDEGASLAEAGAVDGSIFLLTGRRRRPVR